MDRLTFNLQGSFTPPDKRYIAVVCSVDRSYPEQVMHRHKYKAVTIFQGSLASDLDELGCFDDLEGVNDLSIGSSLSLGFPQGSYEGVIITRIG